MRGAAVDVRPVGVGVHLDRGGPVAGPVEAELALVVPAPAPQRAVGLDAARGVRGGGHLAPRVRAAYLLRTGVVGAQLPTCRGAPQVQRTGEGGGGADRRRRVGGGT